MHEKLPQNPQAKGPIVNKKVIQDITFDGPTFTGAIQSSQVEDDLEKQLNNSEKRPTDHAVANDNELLVRVLSHSHESHLSPFLGEIRRAR